MLEKKIYKLKKDDGPQIEAPNLVLKPEDIFKPHQSQIKNNDLRQALNSMYTAWMPLNETVYNTIKSNISLNLYDNNREKFIEDISTDFTILALIFKEIPFITDSSEELDPVKFLRNYNIESLKTVFAKEANVHSLHMLSDMQESQAVMYKYTAFSSRFSKMYAQINNADPLSVYTLSVLRGLANCLLAWNYPRLFSRALKVQQDGEGKLDEFIQRVIGFSPNDLIIELLKTWNFNNETKEAIDETNNKKLDDRIEKSIDSAETMAKLYNPGYFPKAIGKLNAVAKEVKEKDISSVIKREVKRTCKYYEAYAPEIFNITKSIKEQIQDAILAHAETKLRKNIYISQCSSNVKNSFKNVYINISDEKFSKRALEILRYDTMVKAGFGNGCLYILDDERGRLKPILKIGKREFYRYKEISIGNNSPCNSAVIDALTCQVPIRRDGLCVTGESLSYMCASFGTSFKKGVLYLEIPNPEKTDSEMLSTHFKAILRCLNECLGFLVV